MLAPGSSATLGWTMHKVREQGMAVAALEELNCDVNYYSSDAPTVLESLRELLTDDRPANATSIHATGPQIGDAALVHVGKLTHLTLLSLDRTNVGDEGLACLHGLTRLEDLGF